MKTICTHAMYAAALLLLSVPVSCTKDIKEEPEPEDPSSLVIDQKEVTIPAEGGEGKATYTLDNPKDDLRLEAACTAEWITALDTETEGQITFIADANTTYETRETEVTVKYGEDVTGSFKIIQEGAEKPADFVITIDEATLSSITFSITPRDNEMGYLFRFMSKDMFKHFKSDEEVFENDYKDLAYYAEAMGTSIEEYLATIVTKGVLSGKKSERLIAETSYVIYAYGVDTKAKPITSLHHIEAATASVEKIDMTFDITVTAESYTATSNVIPSNDTQRYIFGFVEKDDFISDKDLISYKQVEIRSNMNMYEDYGMSAQDYLKSISYEGPITDRKDELAGRTSYYAYAIAINNDGYLCSELAKSSFETGDVSQSENVITISVSETDTRITNYEITTTNKDEYVFLTLESAIINGMSDEEITQFVTSNYNLSTSIYRGNKKGRIAGLEPEREYTIVAFGYSHGCATTQVFKAGFTTLAPHQSDVVFNISWDKYYRGEDVEAAFPDKIQGGAGLAFFNVKAECTPANKVQTFKYNIFEGDVSDPETMSDEEIIQRLNNGVNIGWREITIWIPYDTDYTIVGFAEDISGNYSAVFRQHVNLSEEGASPLDDDFRLIF